MFLPHFKSNKLRSKCSFSISSLMLNLQLSILSLTWRFLERTVSNIQQVSVEQLEASQQLIRSGAVNWVMPCTAPHSANVKDLDYLDYTL